MARVSARTVPQIFVGGRHVGGCTEVLDPYEQGLEIDPYKFFPAWLHPR